MRIGKKAKMLSCIVIILVIIIIAFTSCSNKDNDDFIKEIKREALSANVLIMSEEHTSSGNISSVFYSAGFSGIIFRKDKEKYYVITAYHALLDKTGVINSEMIILGYDQPTFGNSELELNQISDSILFPVS